MSYSQPLINQPRILLLSIGVGMLLGAAYVIIQSMFRLFGEGRLSYYLADSAFIVLFTLVSFFFAVLYNEGRVRLHLILGEGTGFFVFYFCAGRYICSLLRRLAEFLRSFIKTLFKPYAFIFNSFANGIKRLALSLRSGIPALRKNISEERFEKKTKNFNLFAKIHLKNDNKSV